MDSQYVKVDSLAKKGLRAVGLNTDAVAEARREGRDLWSECAAGEYQIILCSPERLASSEMDKLIGQKSFQQRVGLIVVDEAHLIPIWGDKGTGRARAFRLAFMAIGTLRSRFNSSRLVFLALSATLMPGKPIKVVMEALGFTGSNFSLIKLDCGRRNLHIILQRIRHGFNDGTFKDLDWLLAEALGSSTTPKDPTSIPKAIVYMDHVSRGWQLVSYLRWLLSVDPELCANDIVRHIHAATCSRCKDEILTDFSHSGTSALRIVVATDAFGCGIDIPDVQRVINFGTPRNLDSAYQHIGRSARALDSGDGFIYVNPKLWDDTAIRLGLLECPKSKRRAAPKLDATPKDEVKCCEHFMKILEAHLQGRCIARAIDLLYDNPVENDEGERCERCSGCVKDVVPEPVDSAMLAKKKAPGAAISIPKASTRGAGYVRKEMSKDAHSKLVQVALDIFLSGPDTPNMLFESPDNFLPEKLATVIIKHLRDLETVSLVKQVLLSKNWRFWDSHGEALATEVLKIRIELLSQFEARRAGDLTKQRAARKGEVDLARNDEQMDDLDGSSVESSDSEYESENEEENEPEEAEEDVEAAPTKLFIRLPPGLLRKRQASESGVHSNLERCDND